MACQKVWPKMISIFFKCLKSPNLIDNPQKSDRFLKFYKTLTDRLATNTWKYYQKDMCRKTRI